MSSASSAVLSVLADEWCDRKQLGALDTYGNSDRARRGDLARVAGILVELIAPEGSPGGNAGGPAECATGTGFGDLRTGALEVDVILALVQELRGRYSYATARRTLSTLRSWTRWMANQGILESDPCTDEMVALPADPLLEAAGVAHFDDVSLDALRYAALHPRPEVRTAWPIRDLIVIDLGSRCGCRASEVAGLRWGDVDISNGVLHLRIGTKGRKPRDLPIPGILLEQMSRLDVELHTRPSASDPFITRQRSGVQAAVDRFWVDRLVRRCAREAGVALPIQAVSHALRHSYGVTLASRNVPVPVIQELLGHSDPRTTSVYTRMSVRHLREVLDRVDLL